MKNKLTDLSDHLYETIEFLGDRDIKGEKLKEEVFRAEAQCKVAQQLVATGDLIIRAAQARVALKGKGVDVPLLPEGGGK